MMNTLSRITSYIFHPIWLMTALTALLMALNPIAFFSAQPTFKGVLLLSVFFTTAFIPGIAVLMMKFLNLIPSIEMPQKEHRIGPLIIGGVFHIWMYKNFTDNPNIPDILALSTMAVIVTLFLCFLINLFAKISLHAAGISALTTILAIAIFTGDADTLSLTSKDSSVLLMHPIVLIFTGLLIAGWVGSSRLYLRAHTHEELGAGYFIGAIGPVATFILMG